ncbi:unnamed protein product [Gongylonema pulchrum]|uniref:Tetratricopeptide repeat protein 30 n=1 Tax=Gongylonema pulchrum TaxID=637853 RepID=A0A183DD87_9BILA|nr:unnamed protein product [Gongylonema pulchrum]
MLSISAIVLANLCVCYIMTNQNEEVNTISYLSGNAEELMKKVESEEEEIASESDKTKIFHLCIINLVIGTLYCSKVCSNFNFIQYPHSTDQSACSRCWS